MQPAKMTDSHRQFLQIMMSRGILEGSEAHKLYKHCCEIHKVVYAADKLEDFIKIINHQLQPLFMQIRRGISEENGKQHYALVNLAETEITRMASDYAENELELFRKTMDLIVMSENGFASSMDILNLADQLHTKKMKKKEVEQVLHHLVQDSWLSEKKGEYTLSTRCIIEMEQYIRTMYEDTVKVCNICHNITIQSQMCENCSIHMHIPCLARYFQGRTENPRCPHCAAFWPYEIPVMHEPEPSAILEPCTPSASNVIRGDQGQGSIKVQKHTVNRNHFGLRTRVGH